jgi:hypothetical protein
MKKVKPFVNLVLTIVKPVQTQKKIVLPVKEKELIQMSVSVHQVNMIMVTKMKSVIHVTIKDVQLVLTKITIVILVLITEMMPQNVTVLTVCMNSYLKMELSNVEIVTTTDVSLVMLMNLIVKNVSGQELKFQLVTVQLVCTKLLT